ncbi:aldehyde dehydrogenase [Actinomadura luteofluorescens]|uniref:aldehyde dehydrogenase (NAD(+)) n=1 Tax=Actinomadura luteofluorescens TaxID=46163 RepID=A0A7Y9EP00_9ACTN|nr:MULTISPECIES: aldehyde dehydrogenase [Actinomadura]MCR3745951.1 betaine-aldehyde dehydrogenase [Actinomadura glauciflava]NYD51124.1 betaine-aldehyde dehydrogenase [Actinomadura luteofluorescens]
MREHDRLFIGGEWAAPAGTGVIDVVSPHTEEVIGRVPEGTEGDIDAAVAAARRAFDEGPWPRMTPAERAEIVGRLSAIYAERQQEMADLVTAEMGSPIMFSVFGQAAIPQMVLQYYVDLAASYTWEEERQGMLGPVTVTQEPVGVVAAIVPWNVPQFTLMLKLAPALIAGCTVVAKPSPETPLDSYLLAEWIREAGIPEGVVNIVPAGREVGAYLVAHPDVDKVSFTGSTAAGRRIGAVCGEQLKRVTLELGGKSAAIVLDDADLAATVEGFKLASLMNNGEACAAQTRILASRRRYDEVADALATMVGGLSVGDPADYGCEIGPLVARRQQERVENYIRIGQDEGAKLITGGLNRPHDRGWYVAPTVFGDVGNDMRIAREEIFGPVLVLIPYEDEDDAIKIANDSDYGLGGSVWTSDVEHGVEVARRIRTGSCGVNMYTLDPNTPFGGYKNSGLGRELGPEGLHAYLEHKSIPHPAPAS